jgi:hypothetical protein
MSIHAPFARFLCVLAGTFLIVSGALLLFAHGAADVVFGMQGENAFQNSPLMSAMGIRQFAIGLMIVVLAALREWKPLGLAMVVGAIVPLVDFVIFAPVIGWASSLRHAAPVPVILRLGIYLLSARTSTMELNR